MSTKKSKKPAEASTEAEAPTEEMSVIEKAAEKADAIAIPEAPGHLTEYQQVVQAATERCVAALQQQHASTDDKEVQKGLASLMRIANPVVRGREERNTAWTVPQVKTVYGTTRDSSKPANAQLGDIYTTDGRHHPDGIVFTPLYIFDSHRMFTQGQQAPMCSSPDGKLGSNFGPCNQCPHLPLVKNNRGEHTECDAGLVVIGLTDKWQIYRIDFFKTSYKAGTNVDKLSSRQADLWERWFKLTTQPQSRNGYDYHIYKTELTGNDVDLPTVGAAAEELYRFIRDERAAMLKEFYDRALNTMTPTASADSEGSGATDAAQLDGGDL